MTAPYMKEAATTIATKMPKNLQEEDVLEGVPEQGYAEPEDLQEEV